MPATADPPIPMNLQTVNVDSVQTRAPRSPCHHVTGSNGEMWQWYGDGRDLITRIVAVRRPCMASATAVRHLLIAEMRRISDEFDDAPTDTEVSVSHVRGSRAAFHATSSGITSGIRLHNDVLMATDGSSLYLSRVVSPDTADGRGLAEAMNSNIQFSQRAD